MKIRSNKNASYLDLCYILRENLHEFADKNGRLLAEKALCEKLSASRTTLRKALNELRCGGYIHSQRHRNYISTFSNNFDIGLLVDCYKPAPYIPSTSTLNGITEEMMNSDCYARILVPRESKSISLMVKQFNLTGLLWIDPPKQSLPAIVDMGCEEKIKICSILINQENNPESPLKANYVMMDHPYYGKQCADYFLNKGHKKVIYIGRTASSYFAFFEEMKRNGIDLHPSWKLDKPDQIVKDLPRLLKKEKISGIASHGGIFAASMFESLSKIENINDLNLDILLPYNNHIRKLTEKDPNIKISKYAILPGKEYGVEAMRMLLRQMNEGVDQEPVLLKAKLVDPDKV